MLKRSVPLQTSFPCCTRTTENMSLGKAPPLRDLSYGAPDSFKEREPTLNGFPVQERPPPSVSSESMHRSNVVVLLGEGPSWAGGRTWQHHPCRIDLKTWKEQDLRRSLEHLWPDKILRWMSPQRPWEATAMRLWGQSLRCSGVLDPWERFRWSNKRSLEAGTSYYKPLRLQ